MNKLAIAVLLGLIAGCASVTPNYDAKFGDAVREAKLKMTINPDAGQESRSGGGHGRQSGQGYDHSLSRHFQGAATRGQRHQYRWWPGQRKVDGCALVVGAQPNP